MSNTPFPTREDFESKRRFCVISAEVSILDSTISVTVEGSGDTLSPCGGAPGYYLPSIGRVFNLKQGEFQIYRNEDLSMRGYVVDYSENLEQAIETAEISVTAHLEQMKEKALQALEKLNVMQVQTYR